MYGQRYETLNYECTFGPDLALVETVQFERPEFNINLMPYNIDI